MKYIITGPHNTNKYDIGNLLLEDTRFSVAKHFTSDDETGQITNIDVNAGYANNDFLFLKLIKKEYYEGMTIEQYENNNIIIVEMEDFNNIVDKYLYIDDIVIIWVDSSFIQDKYYIKDDIIETKYLIERLSSLNYLYFINESPAAVKNIIIQYENADNKRRAELLEEYM